jgi:hypothetical protein
VWRLINPGYAIAYRLQKRAAFPGREPVSARHPPPLDRPPWDLGTTVSTEPSHLVILDLGRREIMRVGPLGREREHDAAPDLDMGSAPIYPCSTEATRRRELLTGRLTA